VRLLLIAGITTPCLDWKQRLQITLDVARGLAYLHELVNPQIIHRDLKSANIMLDENFNAKIIDFCISKLILDKKEVQIDEIAGTHVSIKIY
jgi:serine/threonine protein kinase